MIDIKQIMETINEIYDLKTLQCEIGEITLQKTKKGFVGDYTLIIYPFAKSLNISPIKCATEIGEALKLKYDSISDFNVVQGYLNITISSKEWLKFFAQNFNNPDFGFAENHTLNNKKL